MRGSAPRNSAELTVAGIPVRIAVVHSLRNAHELLEEIKAGTARNDFIEVMTCPQGCVGGGGQPAYEGSKTRTARAAGLYNADKMLGHHKSQENQSVRDLYTQHIGQPGGHIGAAGSHVAFPLWGEPLCGNFGESICKKQMHIVEAAPPANASQASSSQAPRAKSASAEPRAPTLRFRCEASLFAETSVKAFVKSKCTSWRPRLAGQDILKVLIGYVMEHNLSDVVSVKPSFCMERCGEGPNVSIGDVVVSKATAGSVIAELERQLALTKQPVAVSIKN